MTLHAAKQAVLRHLGRKAFTVLVNDEILRLPRELRGNVGVDHGRRTGTYFERPAMEGLRRVLRKGAVVFDVGCSYGIVSCLIARIIGPEGRIHAIEANGEVLHWARQIVALNCQPQQVEFFHACAGESSIGTADFFSVDGASSVASTRNADIRHFHPQAQRSQVPLLSLDDFCSGLAAPPTCIKIDVEGSECLVLRGAKHLLQHVRPDIVLETHGLEIDGIGGDLLELVTELDRLGYALRDLSTGMSIQPVEYSSRYREEIGYLLATPQ